MRNLGVGLTADQIAARKNSLGGSDANILMNGDAPAILDLWRVKRGEQEPEDLSGVLPVIMGQWTEELNRCWFERQTGREVWDEGNQHTNLNHPFMACTLDGVTATEAGEAAVFEAKHVNAFSNADEVVQRYMPQLHHNMAVTGLKWAVLSIFLGTLKYEFVEVECDDWYLARLIDREREFWACVESGEPPAEMPPVAAPVPAAELREVDMDGNNEWASLAGVWIETHADHKTFTATDKKIKALMEPDMGRVFGYGVECNRAKNNALRIKEMK